MKSIEKVSWLLRNSGPDFEKRKFLLSKIVFPRPKNLPFSSLNILNLTLLKNTPKDSQAISRLKKSNLGNSGFMSTIHYARL